MGEGGVYFAWETGIHRWDPASSTLDTVAAYPAASARTAERRRSSLADDNPFQPQVRWAVAADGRIAFVHPDPYRVELIGPNGTKREGTPVRYDPVEVTEGHKDDWRRRMTRPRLGLLWEPNRWPDFLPPYYPQNLADAVIFAPDGRLWVQRTTPVGAPPTFDVFDRSAERIEQVTLPAGRRLLGFGNGTVYAVVRDDLDLEYLERYRIRPLGSGT